MSNTILHTYAFLDPGSYGTFCTVSLAEKLGLKGKPANIVLRTMGQQKIVGTTIFTGLEGSGMDSNDFNEWPNTQWCSLRDTQVYAVYPLGTHQDLRIPT